MHGEGFFYQAFVYLSAAVISVPIAKRLGLGSVLGYLLAGVVIGPFGLHLVGEEGQDVMHFAEFGVVMMLFLVGLELEPSLLWRLRGPILGLGGLQISLTAALLTSIGIYGFGLPWRAALAVGLTLALSSTAIVLQTLAEKNLMKTAAGQNSFAVLLCQDLAVIPMLALLPLLAAPTGDAHDASAPVDHGAVAEHASAAYPDDGHAGDGHGGGAHGGGHADDGHGGGHGTTWVEGLEPWQATLVVIGAVALIIIGGRFLTRPMFRFIASAHLREIFTAAGLLLVIGIALLMTKVGLSPALGTFLAGVVLANSEYRHELESDVEPFKGLLLGLFFIAVGASIDFHLIGNAPGLIAVLVGVLVLVKVVVLFALGKIFKLGLDQNLLFTFALAQGGEFAFVLVSFATQNDIYGSEIAAPVIAAVAVSMALTPLMLLTTEKLLLPRIGTKESEKREADDIHEEGEVIIAGFGRMGALVGRLLRANGIKPTVLDIDSDKVDLLRRLGLEVYYGDASRSDLLHAAGADNAKLLILAVGDPEKILEIAAETRLHYPHLRVLACARNRADAYALLNGGVEHVYREALDSALHVGVEALRFLGFRGHRAWRSAYKFRCHDEAYVRELASMRHDESRYIDSARQRIKDLEEILLAELADADEDLRDAGWDVETLRQDVDNVGAAREE